MIVRVPMELHGRFVASRQNFIRDMACVPMLSVSPFFKRRIDYDTIVSQYLVNGWIDSSKRFRDNFKAPAGCNPIYLHFDLAINRDRVGFASARLSHFVERVKIKRGRKEDAESMRVPFVIFDIIGRVEVSKREELDYNMIIDIVMGLTDRGFDIAMITFDRFESSTLRRMLIEMGYVVTNLSVDRTANYPIFDNSPKILEKTGLPIKRKSTDGNYIAAMESLKDSMDEKRCEIPFDALEGGKPVKRWLKFEIDGSEFDGKKNKVDHIPRATNDMLQGMAGACFNMHNNVHDINESDHREQGEALGDGFMQQYDYDQNIHGSSNPRMRGKNSGVDTFYHDYDSQTPTGNEVLGL